MKISNTSSGRKCGTQRLTKKKRHATRYWIFWFNRNIPKPYFFQISTSSRFVKRETWICNVRLLPSWSFSKDWSMIFCSHSQRAQSRFIWHNMELFPVTNSGTDPTCVDASAFFAHYRSLHELADILDIN
jgi:hypothetical protein